MTPLYYHPTLRHRNWQDSGKIATPLFCTGLLWVSALFLLILSPLHEVIEISRMEWPAWLNVPHSTVAIIATSLLGFTAGATLIAQMRGYHVPAWIPLLSALLLFILLWRVL
jgi:hypothetical protein